MAPSKRYVPSGRRLLGAQTVLTEQQYRGLLAQGKPVPQGAQLKLGRLPDRTLRQLRVRFHTDGTVEIPQYSGPEGRLRVVRFLHAQNAVEAVRLVHHQIESVQSSIGVARRIFDEVARLHYDLEHSWQGFNEGQRAAFTQYFSEIVLQLADNPNLLREEQKIHACERFRTAVKLLGEGNAGAAEATMRGIKNNMANWLRRLELQLPRLRRRQATVVDKKFEREKRIWGAVDALVSIFSELGKPNITPSAQTVLAKRLESTSKMLFATGWKAFKQPAIIVGKAVALVKAGNFEKARQYLRDANKKIVLAAAPISSIYPDKLREIAKSTDTAFKQTVLTSQTVLFHDMMQLWWNPKNRQKSALMLESIKGLSTLAQSIGRSDAAQLISKAKIELQGNNVEACASHFAQAAVSLNPELAKEML